ncbi:MAG: hypothetical protein JWM11_2326 [Planctomycetaceae bacterium]|nr:hypothetical protein [Planctomycetaceae bacterium]
MEKLINSSMRVGTHFGGTSRLNEVAAQRGTKLLKNVVGRESPMTAPSASYSDLTLHLPVNVFAYFILPSPWYPGERVGGEGKSGDSTLEMPFFALVFNHFDCSQSRRLPKPLTPGPSPRSTEARGEKQASARLNRSRITHPYQPRHFRQIARQNELVLHVPLAVNDLTSRATSGD